MLDIAQDEIGDRLPLVNGIWADGSLEAARLARMAAEGGASALLVFPPAPFTLGQSPQMAIAHFKRIADATDLPLIVFQYPLATGQGYPKDTLLKMCEEVPTIRAIKDWIGNVPHHEWHVRTLQSLPRPVNVLSTHSAWLLSSLVLGCNGLLSGSGSVIPDLQSQLFAAVQRNDLAAARALNDRIEPLMRVFYADPFVDMHNRMKEALVLLGRMPRAYVRPPLVKIAPARDRAHPRWPDRRRPARQGRRARRGLRERAHDRHPRHLERLRARRATSTSSAGTIASTCRSASACRASASAGATSCVSGGDRRFFAFYEVDSPAVLNSPAYLERLENPTPWTSASHEVVPRHGAHRVRPARGRRRPDRLARRGAARRRGDGADAGRRRSWSTSSPPRTASPACSCGPRPPSRPRPTPPR